MVLYILSIAITKPMLCSVQTIFVRKKRKVYILKKKIAVTIKYILVKSVGF